MAGWCRLQGGRDDVSEATGRSRPPRAPRTAMAASMRAPLPGPTERLTWRWWDDGAADADLAQALWGDVAVTRLIGGPFSVEDVRSRLSQEIRRAEADHVQYWPIFLGSGGAHVGVAGLRRYNPGVGRGGAAVYELGFHLRVGYWGRGLATEAGGALVRYAFRQLHADAVFAGHHPANHASRRVLLKLGLAYTHDEHYGPTGLMHPSYRCNAVEWSQQSALRVSMSPTLHHQPEPEPESEPEPEPEPGVGLRCCSGCGVAFRSRNALFRHLRASGCGGGGVRRVERYVVLYGYIGTPFHGSQRNAPADELTHPTVEGVLLAAVEAAMRRQNAEGVEAASCEVHTRTSRTDRGVHALANAGAAALASFSAAVLTEIYLCNVCSCQEILRRNGRG
jgi:ribosomal-protein-alanine N-acetyltransferase